MVGSGEKLYRAESGCVFLERGNQLEGSLSGVWGTAPAEIECVVLERGATSPHPTS